MRDSHWAYLFMFCCGFAFNVCVGGLEDMGIFSEFNQVNFVLSREGHPIGKVWRKLKL
jgi:hypothetical protein